MSNRPELLKRGDCVAIVSPSRAIFKDQIQEAVKVFQTWGLQVVYGNSLYNKSGYFAGSDEERLTEFQEMIDDPTIKAIFCSRGGYGITRFLDRLNLNSLLEEPKWIVGFSDITALHLKLNQYQIESIHGLMPVQFGYDGVADSIDSLYKILFVPKSMYDVSVIECSIDGEVESELIGGNLSLICESLGTASEINTDAKILFIEEIDEYLYKVDRMLNQLKRAGKFDKLKGVLVGDFTNIKDTEIPFGCDQLTLLRTYFENKDIPVAFGFPAGHENLHLALPFSRMVHMKVGDKKCQITF